MMNMDNLVNLIKNNMDDFKEIIATYTEFISENYNDNENDYINENIEKQIALANEIFDIIDQPIPKDDDKINEELIKDILDIDEIDYSKLDFIKFNINKQMEFYDGVTEYNAIIYDNEEYDLDYFVSEKYGTSVIWNMDLTYINIMDLFDKEFLNKLIENDKSIKFTTWPDHDDDEVFIEKVVNLINLDDYILIGEDYDS